MRINDPHTFREADCGDARHLGLIKRENRGGHNAQQRGQLVCRDCQVPLCGETIWVGGDLYTPTRQLSCLLPIGHGGNHQNRHYGIWSRP